jgi:hypothetical protein
MGIAIILAMVGSLGCKTDAPIVEDATPDVITIVEHIWHETINNIYHETTVRETVTIIEEDTTPDVVYVLEYPSGPVPCLVLTEEGVPAMADAPLSGLAAATVLNDADLMLITQGGTSKKLTADLVRQFLFLDPRYGYIDHTDWNNTDVEGETNWTSLVNGVGASGGINTPSKANLTTGTTATGRSILWRNQNMSIGDGLIEVDAYVYIPTLSDGTDTFTVYVGLGSDTTGADHVNGIYFRYSHGLSSGNWERCTASASSRTQQSTGISVAAATWYRLGLRVNAAGSSVDFLIDGAAAGTITTNIPTVGFGPHFSIVKSAGTTTRVLRMDYYQFRKAFTTAR